MKEPMFPGVEDSVWAYDDQAGKYYRHAFYRHEPDLDVGHPAVRAEIARIVRYWLDRGVDGFRVDAVPYMVRQAAITDGRDQGYWFLTELCAAADGAPLMGEVDAPPEQYRDYFGQADRLHAVLNFWMNNLLFLAIARGDAEPLLRALHEQPRPPDGCTYANWLRNHDELDLERLDPAERDEVMAAFAPAEEMRAFGRGIRRRLAPMLGDDRRVAMAPIPDGVNVADHELQTGSLLSRVSQLAHRRRGLGELPSRCEAMVFEPRSVLGVLHQRADGAVLMLVNLAADEVELRLRYDVGADLLADGEYAPATKDSVRLAGYGYRWLRLLNNADLT